MKSLPAKPSLEFLKKEARQLRAQHKQGVTLCCARIRLNDSSFKDKTDAEILTAKFSINDAQRIIAREYGYSSWTTLKQYIESLESPLYQGVSDKQAYYQGIIESYDQRSTVYDKHVWAREWSIQLVDFLPPRRGDKVLDIGCGSGTIPFYIADKVGPEGSVTGVDISTGMIKVCNEKLAQTSYTNLSFRYGDAEKLAYPDRSFDRIYASAVLYWMRNPQAVLRHWFELLRPGGWIGLTAWPDNSFVWGAGERQALGKCGIAFTVHEFSGNEAKTRRLMELAGFTEINIHVVERGQWMDPQQLKAPIAPGGYTPGQYPDPRSGVPEDTLLLAEQYFQEQVEKLTTEQGVWHDMTTYFVYAQKPVSFE